MSIGKAIKELRKSQGISQAELAEKAKTTQASLSQIESGRRPQADTLKRISKALDIPEALLYISALDAEDLPKENRHLYNDLFPVIKNLIKSLVVKPSNK